MLFVWFILGFVFGALVVSVSTAAWLEDLQGCYKENSVLRNANSLLETENILWASHCDNMKAYTAISSNYSPKNPEKN